MTKRPSEVNSDGEIEITIVSLAKWPNLETQTVPATWQIVVPLVYPYLHFVSLLGPFTGYTIVISIFPSSSH